MNCNGTYVYQQFMQIDGCNSNVLHFGYNVQDADGDMACGSISVNIQTLHIPTVVVSLPVAIDEILVAGDPANNVQHDMAIKVGSTEPVHPMLDRDDVKDFVKEPITLPISPDGVIVSYAPPMETGEDAAFIKVAAPIAGGTIFVASDQTTSAHQDTTVNEVLIAPMPQTIAPDEVGGHHISPIQSVDVRDDIDHSAGGGVSAIPGDIIVCYAPTDGFGDEAAFTNTIPTADPSQGEKLYLVTGGKDNVSLETVIADLKDNPEELSAYIKVADDGHGNTIVKFDATGSGEHFETVGMLHGVSGASLDSLVADGSLEIGRFMQG